jgi:hypothetical protein
MAFHRTGNRCYELRLESKAAFEALLRCRRALGLRLLGPNGSELALDMG